MPKETPPASQFNPTRWSLVMKARGEGREANRALEDLCRAYWFPLYAWCRRGGISPSDAEDLVQGFFVKVLEKGLFASADATRGKLRTFLLTALQRHVRDEFGKAQTQRRGGGQVISFDAVAAEEWYAFDERSGESPDRCFDRQWAQTVLDHALDKLEKETRESGRGELFDAVRPFLTSSTGTADYETAGAAIGMKAGSFKVAVHRMRGKFREALRAEVAETQPPDASIDEEIAYLVEVLRG